MVDLKKGQNVATQYLNQIDCSPAVGGAEVHFSPKFQSHLAEIKLQQFTMQFRKLILSKQGVFKKPEKGKWPFFQTSPKVSTSCTDFVAAVHFVKTVPGNRFNSRENLLPP